MYKTRVMTIFAVLALGFVVFLGAPFGAGCGSDNPQTDAPPLGNIGSVCSVDADCLEGLTCQGGICAAALPPPPPDVDGDGVTDASDNCVDVANADQADSDADGAGDLCDDDDDNDGVLDTADNCKFTANAGQEDLDGDSVGDACDGDKDGDKVADAGDNCADAPNADQSDMDGDGVGNVCDTDADGDAFISVAAGGDDCNDLNASINPLAEDKPDLPLYVDSNCDGQDGDADKAYWVSPTGDDLNPGTLAQPFATIQKAIDSAAADPNIDDVYVVTNATHVEPFININNNSVDGIYGGFAPDGTRDASGNTSIISGRWQVFGGIVMEGLNLMHNDILTFLPTVIVSNSSPEFRYVNVAREQSSSTLNSAVWISCNGPVVCKPSFDSCWLYSSDCKSACNAATVYAASTTEDSDLELTIKNSPFIGPIGPNVNITAAINVYSNVMGGVSRLVMDNNRAVTGGPSGSISMGILLGRDIRDISQKEFTSAQITRNRISGGKASSTVGAYVERPTEQTLLENNFIQGGDSAGSHFGIYLFNTADDVHVVYNSINGGKNGSTSVGLGVDGDGAQLPVIENNIFYGESFSDIGIDETIDVAPQSLQGNLFDPTLDVLYDDFTTGNLTDIAAVNALADISANGLNIAEDAVSFFENVASEDYHLKTGSPATNNAAAGIHSPRTLVDIDGDKRPFGGVSDIGADELTD